MGLAKKSFSETRKDLNLWGRLVESSVGSHLLNGGASGGLELFYWREGNREADYILQKGSQVIALEVKSGRKKVSLVSKFMRRR